MLGHVVQETCDTSPRWHRTGLPESVGTVLGERVQAVGREVQLDTEAPGGLQS